MLTLNKILLFDGLSHLFTTLRKIHYVSPFPLLCGKRIALKHEKLDGMFSIRIWKTNSLLDLWFDRRMAGSSFLGALDYRIDNDAVKIGQNRLHKY